MTAAARQWAESWDASRLTNYEHQCRVHAVHYIYRGPLNVRIWEEKDPKTQDVVAIKHYISTYEQTRTIWMDGRPHPPAWAPHTWMGFSTGRWDGDRLVVETTHIKQGWHRRNGVPASDQTTLTEYFIRHGNYFTHRRGDQGPGVPHRAADQDAALRAQPAGAAGAQLAVAVPGRCRGGDPGETDVPHYLPGRNPYLASSRKADAAARCPAAEGGAPSIYPEWNGNRQQAQAL